jgi:hypothetical protein
MDAALRRCATPSPASHRAHEGQVRRVPEGPDGGYFAFPATGTVKLVDSLDGNESEIPAEELIEWLEGHRLFGNLFEGFWRERSRRRPRRATSCRCSWTRRWSSTTRRCAGSSSRSRPAGRAGLLGPRGRAGPHRAGQGGGAGRRARRAGGDGGRAARARPGARRGRAGAQGGREGQGGRREGQGGRQARGRGEGGVADGRLRGHARQRDRLGRRRVHGRGAHALNRRHRRMVARAKSYRKTISGRERPSLIRRTTPLDVIELYTLEVAGVPYGKARHGDAFAYGQGQLVWSLRRGWRPDRGGGQRERRAGIKLIPTPTHERGGDHAFAAVTPPDLAHGGAASTIQVDPTSTTRWWRVRARRTCAGRGRGTRARAIRSSTQACEEMRQRVARRYRGSGPSQIRVQGLNA